MFRSKDIIENFKIHAPYLMNPVLSSIKKGKDDLDFFCLETDSWRECDNISIDFCIMEKTKNLMVIPLLTHWSDLGCWNSVWEEGNKNSDSIVKSDNSIAIDCEFYFEI